MRLDLLGTCFFIYVFLPMSSLSLAEQNNFETKPMEKKKVIVIHCCSVHCAGGRTVVDALLFG